MEYGGFMLNHLFYGKHLCVRPEVCHHAANLQSCKEKEIAPFNTVNVFNSGLCGPVLRNLLP